MVLAPRFAPWFVVAAYAWLATAPCAYANPQDIEDGEPVTLEDAFTDPPGDLSIQYSGTFTQSEAAGGRGVVESGPTFKLGAISGVQISVNPNYDLGGAEGRNSGFVLSDVLVQFTKQGVTVPAFAVDVFQSTPFGARHPSVQWTVRAIASKYLGPSEDSPRLHLNLTDYHTVQPDTGERRDQVEAVFGGSFLISKVAALVADVVAGNAGSRRGSEVFLEIGYSRDLPDDWTCQLGVGQQVNGRANAVRVFFAVEKELQIF